MPSPWASTDAGSPEVAGSSSYDNGTFTVDGSGSDIWADADQFQYAYQPRDGNGTITARVTAQTNTDPWAKAGIMIKQSTTAGDPYALLAVTPGNGMVFQDGCRRLRRRRQLRVPQRLVAADPVRQPLHRLYLP